MNVITGSEEKCRYGLAWKTNHEAGEDKKLALRKVQNQCVLLTNKSDKKLNNLSNILKRYNYEVVITDYEEKALKVFRNKHCDLLISTIPGIVGVDLLGKIKTLAPETEVSIVSDLELLESYLETIISEAFANQSTLNRAQILGKNYINDFLKNELRLLAAMDYYLERYCF